uniref:Uncharacterized protein n=1 Tax=Knipowitschia caucasica TaxID=637954 RepID=A0AAV2KHC7_KNICA
MKQIFVKHKQRRHLCTWPFSPSHPLTPGGLMQVAQPGHGALATVNTELLFVFAGALLEMTDLSINSSLGISQGDRSATPPNSTSKSKP